MSEETLLSAARRAVRDFNIMMQHGGVPSEAIEITMNTLDIQVQKEVERQRREKEADAQPGL